MEVQYPVYMSEQISQDELEAKSFSRQVISWQSYYVYICYFYLRIFFFYLYIYVVLLSFVSSLHESNTTYIIALSKT